MRVAARLALFASALALAFGGAFAAGSAVDPNPARGEPAGEHDSGAGRHR